MNLNRAISPLVEQQFPSFYHEDGPNFVAFVKAYYEFLEQPGGVVRESRDLLANLDIDNTVDAFVDQFKYQYLQDLPSANKYDQKFSIKHIQDLYKNRGTTEALQLFFRLVYNTDADVYKPGDDLLRASDGKWSIPTYIEIEHTGRNAEYVGKRITGATSGATGIVESVARRKINTRILDVVYLSDVRGNFQVNEYITKDGSLVNAPLILGSLTSATITDGGFGIANGDVFDIESTNGKLGQARVAVTVNGSGQVEFLLVDGGSGYSLANTVVQVSNTVLFHGGNTFNANNYTPSENVVQNTFTYSVSDNSIVTNGAIVSLYNGSSTLLGNGVVYTVNTSTVSVSVNQGNLSTANTIALSSNVLMNVTVLGMTSNTANGKVLAINSTAIGITNVNGTFVRGGMMRGSTSNCLSISTRVSTGANATFHIGSVSNTEVANTQNIGTILSLASINPGSGYDTPPFVVITNPFIAAAGKYDWLVGIANTSGSFLAGQDAQAASGTSGVIRVANATHLQLRRNYYSETLANNQQIVSYFANGIVSGVATINSVANDTTYLMGNNAIVTTQATSLPGVVDQVEVIDSGFGYNQDEVLTFRSQSNTEVMFLGTANIVRQGKSIGFWDDNKGKLNSNKRLHDNDYYQEYSYEVQTDISIDKYADVLKKLLHISGTKLFGSVLKKPTMELRLDSESDIELSLVANASYTALLGSSAIDITGRQPVAISDTAALLGSSSITITGQLQTTSVVNNNDFGPLFDTEENSIWLAVS